MGSRTSDRGGKNGLREWWRRRSAKSLSGSNSLHRGPFLCEGRRVLSVQHLYIHNTRALVTGRVSQLLYSLVTF